MLNEKKFQQSLESVALNRNESLGQYAIDIAKDVCEEYQRLRFYFDMPTYYFCSNEKCPCHLPLAEEDKDIRALPIRINHKNQIISRQQFATIDSEHSDADTVWYCEACASMIEQCEQNYDNNIRFDPM